MTADRIEVGLCLPQFTADAQVTLAAAIAAESDGYDAVSLFDHLRPLGGPPERPILECLTMLTAVAAHTSRVRMLPLVLRASLRQPKTVGSAFRTLELLAPGRIVCGVGTGDSLNEAEDLSVGIGTLDSSRRRQSMLDVMMALRISAPDIPIWVGGMGQEVRVIAGRFADGWNAWGIPAATLATRSAVVAGAAAAAGRPLPRISWGGQVVLGSSAGDAATQLAAWAGGRSAKERAGVIAGDAEAVAAGLQELVASGVRTFLLSFVGAQAARARRAFAQDVLPLVRPSI